MGDDPGFAGSSACKDQNRPGMRDNSGSLLRVEAGRIHRFILRRARKNPLKCHRSKSCMEKTNKVPFAPESPG